VRLQWFHILLRYKMPHTECLSLAGYSTVLQDSWVHNIVTHNPFELDCRPWLPPWTIQPYPLSLMTRNVACWRLVANPVL